MTREPFVLYSSFLREKVTVLCTLLVCGVTFLAFKTLGFSQLDHEFSITQIEKQTQPLSKLDSAHQI